ncbi:MAG: methyl-accepting chemotaxis protein [Desulfuromonadales bacterium]|nr:methyl-accepting chemotaxis protein [Desulfuromonadales bacterium]
MNWITRRISGKIVVAMIAVLAIIMAISTVLIVNRGGELLREELLVKATSLAKVGAKAMEGVLEEALASGRFTEAQLFDTSYQEIKTGPLAGAAIPKYHTAYDSYIDQAIMAFQDQFLKSDEMVVFAVLVDRNGYLPTHNSKYSLPLTGDADKDKVGNRTKRMFNDPTGLAAAKYDGKDGAGYLRQVYKRDTGETMWDVSAPVYVKGQHWGGFRIGFSIGKTEATIAEVRNGLIFTMAAVLLVAAITCFLVVNRMTRPLKDLTLVANRIAEGSLDERIEVTSEDEVGQLAKAFNQMTQVIVRNLQVEIDKSNRIVASVKEAIQQLSTSANELMAISTQQASGAAEQAAAVQQATTTSEEIAATAKQVSENAGRVEALAGHANAASAAGQQAVSTAISGMEHLKGQVMSIAEAMLQLGENSQKIGGIIDIIDEISDQTNLLSLNAAIEAAGAGEAGKRFSIVANEVRRLADRTAEATNQVKALIAQIQQATNGTIMLTEEGTKGVDAANALVANISQALGNVTRAVGETTAAASEIKLMTQQQTTASEQMADTIAEVRDVATQVAVSSQETTQSITELTTLAERLQDLVEENLLDQAKVTVQAAATEMARVLTEAVDSGKFTVTEIFDENYQLIANTKPQKYHTRYDQYLDETIQTYEDSLLTDSHVTFAVLVDRNGYLPTHNSRYCQPLTGDFEKDKVGNRTKRLFNDKVGLTAARYEGKDGKGYLQQVYERDTGERMWDISAPVLVKGRHWGAFRIGYLMD